MRRIRAGAWIVLLLLAGFQAWATRFYPAPDGVSYLDLSDAVLQANFAELLNAYWSPLYPILIGLLRAAITSSAYWEFAITHLVNFCLFVASLRGYEYLLGALRQSTRWHRELLATRWEVAGAYFLFGAFTLMMTPLILPTPDLLVSAACFFVFGALLRLHAGVGTGRAAVVLGVALALGSLAKSFVIPWAVVCLLTAAVACRRRSSRPVILAAALWLTAVVPWTIGLSMKAGHFTFGDTGRLTYVWYVNQLESPSRKIMPHAAATPASDSILRGIAITPDAPGTNPVWYDPARWYAGISPRFEPGRQARVFGLAVAEYIASLAPVFLVLAFWLIAAGRDAVREWWAAAWPVMIPVLTAIAAYSLVLVTTRYVAPFYIAMTLMVLAGVRRPDVVTPGRVAAALGLPLAVMLLAPDPGRPVALVNAAAGTVLFVWLARRRTPAVMLAMALIGALSVRVLQPASDIRLVMVMSAALIVGYWAFASDASSRGEGPRFTALSRQTLLAANATLILMVAWLKYSETTNRSRIDLAEPNDVATVARQAALGQIEPGERIALVGSPFEAYWARASRVGIVAVVPPPVMGEFNGLSTEQRQALYREFARAGARHVVVQQQAPPAGGADRWTPVRYVGWVKRLP
jgi:hypothetical protein